MGYFSSRFCVRGKRGRGGDATVLMINSPGSITGAAGATYGGSPGAD